MRTFDGHIIWCDPRKCPGFKLGESYQFNQKIKKVKDMEDMRNYKPTEEGKKILYKEIFNTGSQDRLAEIMRKQELFQNSLGYKFKTMTIDEKVHFIHWNSTAMIDEIMEGLRETPWKPWKKKQFLNLDKYKDEMIDLLHFFINACLVCEFTPAELFDAYKNKMFINIKRQQDGY